MGEYLQLDQLKKDVVVQVIAGFEPNAYKYNLRIVEPGKAPLCALTQIDPKGKVTGPAEFVCEGTGRWTTPEQNPTQIGDPLMGKPHQKRAITINYGVVSVGGFLIAHIPGSVPLRRLQFEPECTEVNII